jgi:hypothetical protein
MSEYRVMLGRGGKLAWVVYAVGIALAALLGYVVGERLAADGEVARIERWCPVAVRSLQRRMPGESPLVDMDAAMRSRLARFNSGSYALVAALLLLPIPGFSMRRRCGGSGTCPDCSCDRSTTKKG